MSARYVVAAEVSEHPIPAHATGECLGELLERGGPDAELVVVAVTAPVAGALEDVMGAVADLLSPTVALGVVVSSVTGGAREVEEQAAVMMFGLWDRHRSGSGDGSGSVVRPVRLVTNPAPGGSETTGLDELRGAQGTLLLFADPFSTDTAAVLDDLAVVAPELSVVGGHLSGALHAGGNRMTLDGRRAPGASPGALTGAPGPFEQMTSMGAIGALLGPEVPSRLVVAQGGRPVGHPLTATVVEGSNDLTRVVELDGRPALEVLSSLLDDLSPEDREAATTGLLLGRVLQEPLEEWPDGTGPQRWDAVLEPSVLSSPVLGIDRTSGSVAVHGDVPAGSLVRFEVRDADASVHDLILRLSQAGADAAGVFVVTSTGRGMRHHGVPDRDAGAVAEMTNAAPVAGTFLTGEFATVGGRHRLLTTSVAVLLVG